MGVTSISTLDQPTAAPTIKSAAITLRSTVHFQTSTSLDRGRKLPKNTSLTLIWSQVSGRSTRLKLRAARRGSMCMGRHSLIVNNLKLEPKAGGVALWIEPGTEGYFSNLK